MYFPYGQDSGASMDFVVRTAGDPLSAVSSMRAAIAELDPAIPLYAIATMDQVMGASDAVFRRRSVLVLMAAFAGAALVLAAVGIYGVLAQVVAQRRRDIGIRLALGAGARQVVTSVLRPGLVAVVIGLSVGVAGSLAAGRALGSLLFRTDPADSRSLLLVVTVLAVAAAMAAIAPARRALRVDPVESLRID
jgi:ABC-type antimicrobial peptide transport system permease subunit